MKKILLIDDSALMRRVLCDIIESDGRFQVTNQATDGIQGLEMIQKNEYDAIVLDVNMPKMSGIGLLREMQNKKVTARVMMSSTDTKDGASVTIEALELGAMDYVQKPSSFIGAKDEAFKKEFLKTLSVVVSGRPVKFEKKGSERRTQTTDTIAEIAKRYSGNIGGNKVVAIASSTGGPKVLQEIISSLPDNIKTPILIVQHMPAGFTKTFAERLDAVSRVAVHEAIEGEKIVPGTVYLSKGGAHMNVVKKQGQHVIHYSMEPAREGVRPCANYMYESFIDCGYDEIVCVVLTGMGADGTKGIQNLKKTKQIHVIVQEEKSCAVYGMPKSIVTNGLANQIIPSEQIAQEIIMNVGVR